MLLLQVDGFNPHPTRRPGATNLWFKGEPTYSPVSILTRPGGRVLRSRNEPALRLSSEFQSSPDPEAGCYELPHPSYLRWDIGFNPHPTRRPGATPTPMAFMQQLTCFNPHPTRRPGATVYDYHRQLFDFQFQSSPDPEAGCYMIFPQVLL